MAFLKIAFLDVGHGDFVYAETPSGQNLVIDVGSGDVVPSEFLSKVSTISELQISHPHTDHFDDIIAISKKKIQSFRCPSIDAFSDDVIGWKNDDKPKIAKLREMKKSIPPNDSAVPIGNGFVHTCWVPPEIDKNNPNTASIVTTLSYGGTTVLFGGDLPDSGWQSLLKNPSFLKAISGATVFKVPHHGRKEGRSEALFKTISPMLCIISDKEVCDNNENTVATNWYTERSSGCNVGGCETQRKVLTTRADKSIFMKINESGTWWVYRDTRWKTD